MVCPSIYSSPPGQSCDDITRGRVKPRRVLTARHHEGFALFDSEHSNAWTSVQTIRRDLFAEYVKACRATGLTGQIETDYGQGVYRVNSPTAQAVAGFLREAGPQHLADVEIACRNRYATIVIVPLDGQPIRQSDKLLVQVGTVCRPTGWTVVPTRALINGKQSDCFRVLSTGKMPFQVENTEATITVGNPGLSRAVVLDINGMATRTPVEVRKEGGKLSVALPPKAMYWVLSK